MQINWCCLRTFKARVGRAGAGAGRGRVTEVAGLGWAWLQHRREPSAAHCEDDEAAVVPRTRAAPAAGAATLQHCSTAAHMQHPAPGAEHHHWHQITWTKVKLGGGPFI